MGLGVFKPLPTARPPGGWGEIEHRVLARVQRILPLPESHRVRVVKLEPHKRIQVIRGHPYKGEMGVGVRGSSQGPPTGQGWSVWARAYWGRSGLGLPGGAGRFIPRTMIRCISVLLSSEKILQPGSKEKELEVKERSGKGSPSSRTAHPPAGWWPRIQ